LPHSRRPIGSWRGSRVAVIAGTIVVVLAGMPLLVGECISTSIRFTCRTGR